MEYTKEKLKNNGDKAPHYFKLFPIEKTQTNACLPGLCCMFHSDTFLLALPVS
jgi:hypothetical protein